MKIVYESEKNEFFAYSEYAEKDVLKNAGFKWNPTFKHWITTDLNVAAKLSNFFDNSAVIAYNQLLKTKNKKIAESKAIDSVIDIPKPSDMEYMPYQKAGIEFLIKNQNILLADEMGLGKTIQVIGMLNYLKPKKVLIIMPLSVKRNWLNELNKWLVYKPTIEMINGKIPIFDADITLIHYDALKKYSDVLSDIKYDVIVVDEAHYIKNGKALRTKAILQFNANKKILLTGTPIVNRPNELFTLLKFLNNPIIYNSYGHLSYKGFIYRYCTIEWNNGYSTITGGKNLEELQTKLRTSGMIRRLKQDVLVDLPAKRRQMIPITLEDKKLLKESILFTEKIKQKAGDWNEIMSWLKGETALFTEMSKIRHELGVAKIPYAISFIEDVLENENKIVVFAHHRDVIDAITEHFTNSAKLYGGMSEKEREMQINKFNTDDNCHVFVGSIEASGVGINLQIASTAVFVELDWRPSSNSQAEDRIHRIGQKNSVMIYDLVFDETLDAIIVSKILQKQYDIDKALDIEIKQDFIEFKKSMIEESNLTKEFNKTIKENSLMKDKILEILEALKILNNNDMDYAIQNNGIGFNKIDTEFGHSLANKTTLTEKQIIAAYKLIRKYKKQIPEELYNKIYKNEVI